MSSGYGPHVSKSALEQFLREEEERRQAEQDEIDCLRELNEQRRREWQERLKAEEDRKRAEQEARLELELQPIQDRERRQRLREQAEKTEGDFEKHTLA